MQKKLEALSEIDKDKPLKEIACDFDSVQLEKKKKNEKQSRIFARY